MTRRESRQQTQQIIGLFPELLGVGGVQEAGRQTALALEQIASGHGWLTRLLSLNDAPGRQTVRSGDRQIDFLGYGRAKPAFVWAAIRECQKRASVVVAAHPHLAVPAALAKMISPALSTIVMCHGVEVWQPLTVLRRHALLRATLVLAPSQYTARKLCDVQRVSDKRIRLLPWPLDDGFLVMADSTGTLSVPQEFPDGRVILTVGRWAASERYKGADQLIRATAKLRSSIPDLHLVAVGGGDDLPRLRNLAGELGVSDCVHFLESLSRDEIAGCYARATVFALPSTGEGFGLVFLEAMAFGKAIVAVSTGGTTDVVEHEVNGLLVPPCDTEKLTEALARLFSNESLRFELGRCGAAMARQRHQFGVFRAELERILVESSLPERTRA